jgi:hypothetical protein
MLREANQSVTDPRVQGKAPPFEVAVALQRPNGATAAPDYAADSAAGGAIPGYDEAFGRRDSGPDGRRTLLARGEDAVRAATEAIAGQIALAAQRIAEVIDAEIDSPSGAEQMSLESVQVSFGIALSAGIQTVFTSSAESSAQVTITLARPLSPAEQD